MRSHRYNPLLEGGMADEEAIARRVLSQTAHKNYFIEQLKRSEHLQCQFDDEAMKHKSWPLNDYFDHTKDDHASLGVGMRCPCWRRVGFTIKYKHEPIVNIRLKKSLGSQVVQ